MKCPICNKEMQEGGLIIVGVFEVTNNIDDWKITSNGRKRE